MFNYSKNEIILGSNDQGLITAEIKEDRTIRGFNEYSLVGKTESYDNNYYFVNWGWCHNVKINNVEYASGTILAEDHAPYYEDERIPEVLKSDDYYVSNGSFCEECGTFHDTDQYYDVSFTITDHGGFYCKSCCPAEELLVEVNCPQDIFSSKDMTGVDLPDNYEEVKTLFCDSSGFGSSYEPAMTKEQAEEAVRELLETSEQLYAGLTGIGQFQVYVTLYKQN